MPSDPAARPCCALSAPTRVPSSYSPSCRLMARAVGLQGKLGSSRGSSGSRGQTVVMQKRFTRSLDGMVTARLRQLQASSLRLCPRLVAHGASGSTVHAWSTTSSPLPTRTTCLFELSFGMCCCNVSFGGFRRLECMLHAMLNHRFFLVWQWLHVTAPLASLHCSCIYSY